MKILCSMISTIPKTKIDIKNIQFFHKFDLNPQETTSDSIDRLLERVVVFYRLFCQVTCEWRSLQLFKKKKIALKPLIENFVQKFYDYDASIKSMIHCRWTFSNSKNYFFWKNLPQQKEGDIQILLRTHFEALFSDFRKVFKFSLVKILKYGLGIFP